MCGAPPDVCSCGCLAGEFETCGGDGHSFWVEGCSETESCIEWEMCEGACHEVGGRSLCTRDLPTCEDVQRVYEAAVDPMAQACGDDGECVVLEGHCGIGLGGCHHAVTALYEEPGFLRQTLLDALSKRWIELACTGAVCDCAEPPSDATCVTGLCTATP